MYIATMEYPLRSAAPPAEAAAVWRSVVEDAARGRAGLIGLQLFSRPGTLLAVGQWEDKSYAEAFMRTGVFVELKARLAPYLDGDPQPRLWDHEASISPK